MSECYCNEGGICHPCFDGKCDEVKALKAVAIQAIDYLAVELKKNSPEDYEPEKSPLIMGLRERVEG